MPETIDDVVNGERLVVKGMGGKGETYTVIRYSGPSLYCFLQLLLARSRTTDSFALRTQGPGREGKGSGEMAAMRELVVRREDRVGEQVLERGEKTGPGDFYWVMSRS